MDDIWNVELDLKDSPCTFLLELLVGAHDLRTLWSRLVPHPCPENNVLKKFQVLDHVKPPMWNPGSQNWDPTSWKSRPKSFQVSVLETASVKIQAPKLRSQVLKTMSWKPYPKISQVFLGLGNPECKLQVSKNWGSHILKISRFGSWKPTSCTSQNWNLTSWKSCP